MKIMTWWLPLMAAMMMVPQQAQAMSANELVAFLGQKGSRDTAKVVVNSGPGALLASNAYLASKGQAKMFCAPAVTPDQEVAILIDFLGRHPDWGAKPVELALLLAMVERFPC